MERKPTVTLTDFEQIDFRAGTIVRAEPFPKARKPALKLWIDLGAFGIKQSSAQITEHYQAESLPGSQVVCVVNFPPRQIADFISEVLVTGIADENGYIRLVRPDASVPNGNHLH